MRTEYFLTCKKNYYSNSGKTFLNLFKKALFVKGQKYKVIKDVISGVSGISGVGGVSGVGISGSTIAVNPPYSGTTTTTSTTCTTTTSTTNSSYRHSSWTNYTINGTPVTENFVSEYFYTLKEERHLKLMKLKKLSYEEEEVL